ncbi:MAG: hypothetical protein KKF62_15190 [Bacteroidetes bacterium]|nr:hypothetical protein [Bacteroidota bacterium]
MKKIIIVLVVFASFLNAQDYNETASRIFFGRHPSAKTESMGRILTLGYDNNFLTQSNPASLMSTEGISIFYSQSSRLYFFDDLNYYCGGVSYKKENIGAFAFNVQYIDLGEFTKTTINQYGPIEDGVFRVTDQLYTLTYSNTIYNWFSLGINVNLLNQTMGWENNPIGTFFEVGLLKSFNLIENTLIRDDVTIGTHLKNIFNQSITYKSDVSQDSEVGYLPSIFRIGISNVVEYFDKKIYKHSHLIGLTTGFEYQNVLNSDYRTAYKFGGELSILDVVYLRFGYYHETLGVKSSYFDEILLEEFTYGFGFNLNLEHYLNNQFPMSIKIDYVNLPQPSHGNFIGDWDNFNTFNLIINYRFH